MHKGHILIDLAGGLVVSECSNKVIRPPFLCHTMTEETTSLLIEIASTPSVYGFCARHYDKYFTSSEEAAKNFIIKIFNELQEDDKRLSAFLKSKIIAYALKHSENQTLEKNEHKNEN